MIAEASNTTQRIIDQISAHSPKAAFISQDAMAAALLRLEQSGLPTGKNEDYKYCNIDAFFRKDFKDLKQSFAPVNDVGSFLLQDTITIVVVNGVFSETLSDKVVLKGLHISPISDASGVAELADPAADSLVALNTAFAGGGVYIRVEKNTNLSIPLQVLYVTSAHAPSLASPRCFIELGENSSATVIEHFVNAGEGKVFSNYVGEKLLQTNARLKTYTLQESGPAGYGVYTSQVYVATGGSYDNTTVTLSGELVRNNHNVELRGRRSEAHLYGLFHGRGSQLIDNHTLVDHREPHCDSNELYKGLVADKATGVFNGKIFVRQDAQKTNAYQSSKNILLSDDATINTKPQLEIYANDVKCSHGTSTGRIDEEAMFYLRSRGVGTESARKLLLASFAGEVLERISVDSLKERAQSIFESALQQ